MKAEGECGQSLPRRRGGPVINIPYPLCLGLPLRHDTDAPYLGKTLLPSIHPLPTPPPPQGRTRQKPLKPLSHPRLNQESESAADTRIRVGRRRSKGGVQGGMVGQRRPEQIRRRASCPRHYSRLRCDRPASRTSGPPFLLFPEINTFARLYPAERGSTPVCVRSIFWTKEFRRRLRPYLTRNQQQREPLFIFLAFIRLGNYCLRYADSFIRFRKNPTQRVSHKHIPDYQFSRIFWC